MRSCTINLPKGLEVDIFDLPEDFKEQVEQAFKEYTSGTAKAYMCVDKLGFIDLCVEYLNGKVDSSDAVNTLVEEEMIAEWRANGEIIKEQLLIAVTVNIFTIVGQRTGRWLIQAGKQMKQGTFSASRWSHNRNKIAGYNFEICTIQSHHSVFTITINL